MSAHIVYRRTCVVTGKAYIGITMQGLETRFRAHCNKARGGSNYAFHRAIRKHGIDAWRSEVLHTTSSASEAVALEIAAIARLGTISPNGYNLTAGGEGTFAPSDETRQRMSRAARSPERLAVLLSDERRQKLNEVWDREGHREKMRAVARDQITNWNRSNEAKLATSKRWRGVSKTAEQRAKIAATLTGRQPSTQAVAMAKIVNTGRRMSTDCVERRAAALRQRFEVTTPSGETLEISGLVKFCRERDLNSSAACAVAAGRRHHHKGYRFRKVNDCGCS